MAVSPKGNVNCIGKFVVNFFFFVDKQKNSSTSGYAIVEFPPSEPSSLTP